MQFIRQREAIKSLQVGKGHGNVHAQKVMAGDHLGGFTSTQWSRREAWIREKNVVIEKDDEALEQWIGSGMLEGKHMLIHLNLLMATNMKYLANVCWMKRRRKNK